MPFDSTQTPRDPRQRLQSSAYQPTNRGGPGNPGTANNMPQNDPFNQYGYGAQSPQLGRYVPPMLQDRSNLQSWGNQGGYAYNIPNSYGSTSWNQFNSTDRAPQDFGQVPQDRGFQRPMPQLSEQGRNTLAMFAGLPGMSSVVDPYRDQLFPRQTMENAGPTTPGMTGVVAPQIQANYGMGQAKPLNPYADMSPLGPGGKVMPQFANRQDSDGDGYGDEGQFSQDKNRFTDWVSNVGRNIGTSFRDEMRQVGEMFKPGGFTNAIRNEGRQLREMMGFGPRQPQGYAGPRANGSNVPSFAGAQSSGYASYRPGQGGSTGGTQQSWTVPQYGGGGYSGGPGLGPSPTGGEQQGYQPYNPNFAGNPQGPVQGGVVRPQLSNNAVRTGRSLGMSNQIWGAAQDDRALGDMQIHSRGIPTIR